MKYLIFDFNGTVLDDLDVCVKCENKTIEHYKLDREPLSKEEYLRIFTFPVKDYYEAVGFDWNKFSYEEVGAYWFSWYRALKDEYKVHDGVIDVLNKVQKIAFDFPEIKSIDINPILVTKDRAAVVDFKIILK